MSGVMFSETVPKSSVTTAAMATRTPTTKSTSLSTTGTFNIFLLESALTPDITMTFWRL